MLKRILIAVVILIAILLIWAATRPDTFSVQRTISINATPARIEPLISDLHNWSSWSPFEKYDPAMKKTFSGAERGKGAVYEWEGNSRAGKGRMEITSVSPSLVAIKLDFIKPFEGHDSVEFTLEPHGQSTNVTWAMHGENRYIAKVMGLFMSMDKMIGREFDTGLASLKAVAEK